MAIQFQCPGCRQPIEVDDVWAEKLVACPYCRQTVTAPSQSTLELRESVGGARPLASDTTPTSLRPHSAVQLSDSRNTVALFGLLLAIGAWVTLLGVVLVVFAHMGELGVSPGATPQQVQRHLQEQIAKNPPGWLLSIPMLSLLGAALWLGGLICSIIGLRHAQRRVLASTGLALSGVYALFLCGSFLLSVL